MNKKSFFYDKLTAEALLMEVDLMSTALHQQWLNHMILFL